MYTATITSQGQITLPAEARRRVGFKPGDKVVVVPQSGRLHVMKIEGWDDMRGILKKYTKVRRYPTKEELAEGWAADYRRKWLKNAKSPR